MSWSRRRARRGVATLEPKDEGSGNSSPGAPTAGWKRNFNEAAHKLGYWPVAPGAARATEEPSAAIKAGARRRSRRRRPRQPARARRSARWGSSYGDIGTSPLYTMQVIFGQHTQRAHTDDRRRLRDRVADLLGADDRSSRSSTPVFIMRAHNRGDGGIMALTALISAQEGPARGGADHARHLRRRPVLRRRDDHARRSRSPPRSRG